MSVELSELAALLAKLQKQAGAAEKDDGPDLAPFRDVLGEIHTALADIVGVLEAQGKARAVHERAEDARRRADQEAGAKALSRALADALAKLKVESRPDVAVEIASVAMPPIKVPALTAPTATIARADVSLHIDPTKLPVPQVTLLPAPPNPPAVHRVSIERDHNGFIREMTVTRIPGRAR